MAKIVRSFVPVLLALGLFSPPPAWAGQEADPIIRVEVRQDIRVVYDIKTDEWEAGIGRALYYVRGLYEAYAKQGVKPEQLHLSLVLHGPTVYWLLDDAAYQNHTGDPFAYNPNRQTVDELIHLGASVEACNSTMKGRGWKPADLLPGVKAVHDGYSRMIDLQQRGYGYIRF